MKWFKRGLSLVLLGVLIYFFWPFLGELEDTAELFLTANWIWFVVAILIQFVSYTCLTWLNALALQPFDGKIGFWNLAAVLTSMAFVQIAIPSAGISGTALRVRLLGKFGYTPEDSLFSLVVESLAEFIAIVLAASLGVAYLLRRTSLLVVDLAGFFLVGLVGLVIMRYLWRLLKDRNRSRIALEKLVVLWNRVGGRFRHLDLEHSEERLTAFQGNLKKYKNVPVWKFMVATSMKVILDVATFGVAFLLFGYTIAPDTLLVGYGVILTVSGLATLPGGIGMADAYIPVLLSWFGVPGAVALAAGLVYRLVAYWLVRFVGFISWQFLESRY